jgi:DNA mismatch repair protein MutL
MSDVIQLLPDSVANQIAAGEVIQRPASVIKELVENAVDAGAHTVHVLVVDAGRTSIQVIDDGQGMSDTDARLAFERHATSKIRQADDLFALHTMGFRGEALPSIAAVSQVELLTRMAGQELGTRIVLSASKVVSQEMASCPVGSNFKVTNLFFNVPARRKFLKTNATELNNVLTAFERIVLVYPDIAFSLHSNDTELLYLKANPLRQRICDVFGKRFNQDLLSIAVDTAICRISGFVGKPEAAKKKGAHQYFFVNGRFMKHPYFHRAVLNAYERLVAEGMQVPYFIYFDVSPSDIDVNIHPTKTEIKFENEQAIFQILSAAVKDAIGQFCEVTAINFDTEGRPDIPVFDPTRDAIATPRVNYNPDYNPFSGHSGHSSHSANTGEAPFSGNHGFSDQSAPPPEWEQLFPAPQQSAADRLLSEKSPVHYQYKGCYVMSAVKSGLMIIDQHRADVRIRYERTLATLSARNARTQRVLFPEVVQFPPSDAVVMEKILPELMAVGFDLTDLGGNSYAINGVPAGTEGLNPATLVSQMVAAAVDEGVSATDEIHHSLALSLSRSAAIPYGQVLSNDEMETLVNQLFGCSNVNYTPDGKSILAILPHADIEHLLG